jgi:hypothetical protein
MGDLKQSIDHQGPTRKHNVGTFMSRVTSNQQEGKL